VEVGGSHSGAAGHKLETLSEKQMKSERTGTMAQVVA
jgi:hypothetical protein